MRIRYLKAYGPHPAGRVFDHPIPGVAAELCRRKIAVEVLDDEPQPEAPAAAAPAAAKPQAKPKRG